MAVLTLKPKPKPGLVQTTPLPASPEVVALIDELGAMQGEQAAIAAEIKELQARQQPYKDKVGRLLELVADTDQHDPDEGFSEDGAHFKACFGKQTSSRRIIDLPKLRALLGDEVFFQVASVALKHVDDYLTPKQREQVLETERGLRTVSFVRRI